MSQDQLSLYIRDWMQQIDEHLAESEGPLRGRILRAAIFFVENVVIDISNDTKDEYSEKPWFAIIYWHIRKWYEDFYGEQLNEPTSELPGFLYVNGTPFELHIPITKAEVEEVGVSSTMFFPVDVSAADELEDWFQSAPNMDMLTVDGRAIIDTQLARLVRDTRTLNLGLMTATIEDPSQRVLARSSIGHLRSATTLAMSNNREGLSVAVWEIHMMVEKIMKAFLEQKNIAYAKTHNLDKLREQSRPFIDSTEVQEEFKKMLSGSEAVKYRYCEGDALSNSELFDYYISALSIASYYADSLDRKYGVKNARITFKKPAWLDLHDSQF